MTIEEQMGEKGFIKSRRLSHGLFQIAVARPGINHYGVGYHQQALAIAQEICNRRGEGIDLGCLGRVYAQLGQYQQAIGYYQQALAIAKEIGDCYNEGTWLENLGLAYRDLGQMEQARQAWEQALSIFEEIELPRARMVRQWLS